MHEEALPEASSDFLASLTACDGDELRGWVLAEGTGLALQLGHRISEDFDFFRTSNMDTASLFDWLQEAGTCEVLQYGERTLSVLLRGVLLSFSRSMLRFCSQRHRTGSLTLPIFETSP